MRIFIFFSLVILCRSLFAQTDVIQFNNVVQEKQWREITQSLRCPKCQNSSIADSDAPIAEDMRQKVFTLQQEGKNRKEIIEYMISRYGEFVTYQPPLTYATSILWFGPLIIILGGIIVISQHIRTDDRKSKNMLSGDKLQ